MVKILSVVGARPQFVKLAPIAHAMAGRAQHVIVHTGQHYDELMSNVFFRDLGIPEPDVNLAIGSGKHGAQTGAMLAGLEEVFERYSPDWVLVYGDTNSTVAAALAAVKMHLRVAHLEAGLRSFNRRMPEEHNRVLTDHAADILFAPTQVAAEHLHTEGIGARTIVVGDVMTDVLVRTREAARSMSLPAGVKDGRYYVATIHRPDNTDSPVRLRGIIDGLASLDHPVLLLAHPRLLRLAANHRIELAIGAISVREPMPYPQLVRAVDRAVGVVTDSGGLQKEAFLLRTPATTVRTETEWVETVDLGWNRLVGPDPDEIRASVMRPQPTATDANPYGDGSAARRVVETLIQRVRGDAQ